MLIYIVKPGDTLTGIAREFGVSLSRLILDNGLSTTSQLVTGQALIIMRPSSVYTVKPGDTLESVAAANGTTVMKLLQNNPSLIFNRNLRAGTQLTLAFEGGNQRTIEVNGYAYPFIENSVLLRCLPYLTYLSIFSYGFADDGQLIPIDDNYLIQLAYEYKAAPIMVLTTIDENENFSPAKAKRLLNDIPYQNVVLDNIVATMKEKGYLGLDIDFEFINPEDADSYINFLRNASAKMNANGFKLSVALAPKTYAEQPGLLYEAHNYPVIGSIADTVFLMTYEWGYAFGPPMAVAPINQVRNVVNYAITEIPIEKLQLGIPNYGYDWTLPYMPGGMRALTIGNQEALRIAIRGKAEIQFDQTSMSPFFEYSRAGRNHIVWFEDVRSIQAKFDLADEFSLPGVGYWNLMRPFAQNWSFIASRYNVAKIV
ncbi:MAG: LysM peptidoglycan-binding domain-containing protein [Acutalibacteraceae bacterium]